MIVSRIFKDQFSEEDVEFYSPKYGWEILDIIPYEVSIPDHPNIEQGDLWWRKDIKIHHFSNSPQMICPESVGKICPICSGVNLIGSGFLKTDVARSARPRARTLFNVQRWGSDQIMLFNASTYLFSHRIDEEIERRASRYIIDMDEVERENPDYDPKIINFYQQHGGRSIHFCWSEFGGSAFPHIRTKEAQQFTFLRRESIPISILKSAYDLDRIIRIPHEDELIMAFRNELK